MSKKIIIFAVLLVIAVFVLSSCGNRQVGIDINQTFKRAFILLNGTWKEVELRSWRDFKEGDEVQIITSDGKVYLTYYTNVVLVNE